MGQKFCLADKRIAGAVQKILGDRRGGQRGKIAGKAAFRAFNDPVRGIGATFRAGIADDLVIETAVEPAGFQRLGHDLRPDARGVAQRDPNAGAIWHLLRKDGCRLWRGGL